MIRPNEITFLVLDVIEKWLSKYDNEEIELSENKNYIFAKSKKPYDGHLFDVDTEYNDTTMIAELLSCKTLLASNAKNNKTIAQRNAIIP